MKSNIPDKVKETLKEIGMTHEQAGWNCHGTYVLLHKALEKVAVHKGIVFNEPKILETNSEKRIVSLLVTGKMGDKSEWSIGEAAPSNNKNSYPYAMAEKRAKDRVILKLVGLHGDVYAEDEADAFKEARPQEIQGGTIDNGYDNEESIIEESSKNVSPDSETSQPITKKDFDNLPPDNLKPRELTAEERRQIHEKKLEDFDHWCQQKRTISQLHAYFNESKNILGEMKEQNVDLYKKAVDIFTKHEANLERKTNG